MNKRQKKYLENFQQMIAFETISVSGDNDVKKFRQFHKLLKELFPNVFKNCLIEDFDGSLLITWKGLSSDNPCLFMNHQDVVEANGDWKYPPFSATVKDGILYGRGTLDTKGGLFAMLQAADDLISEGFVPAHDIYFESACDEETGGKGARNIAEILKERNIRFSYLIDEGGMIVDEPMKGVHGKYAMIGLAERNGVNLKFVAKSNGGHASTPGQDTPLVRLGKMMAYFDDHQVFDVKVNDIIVEMLKRLSLSMDGALAFLYKNAALFRPILKIAMPKVSPVAKAMTQTTIAFTMAKGSEQVNVLPQSAYVMGDMRVSHHQGTKSSIAAAKEVAKKFDVEVEVLSKGLESNVADFACEGFKLAEKAVEYAYGNEVKTAPYIMNQCSDARSMAIVCDNCLRFSPLSISNEQMKTIHGLNENVGVDCLDKAVDFYIYMMKDGNV